MMYSGPQTVSKYRYNQRRSYNARPITRAKQGVWRMINSQAQTLNLHLRANVQHFQNYRYSTATIIAIYLQSTIVEVHDYSFVSTEPFLHEDGGRLSLGFPLTEYITAVDQVLVHVLSEVEQQRGFLLVLSRRRLRGERVDFIAQVIVLDGPEQKHT